jgi:hypothetical protein
VKRETNTDKAKEPNIVPQLLTEKEAAIYLGFAVNTLQQWRGRTPKRYTKETMAAAAARGERIYPALHKNRIG